MSHRFHLGTRKGLFTFSRGADKQWHAVGEPAFFGVPVSMLLCDPRDGRLYAALNHGHFGVKLHASDDDGKTWQEITPPAFDKDEPGRIAQFDGSLSAKRPSVAQIWAMEAGGADQSGLLWMGTIPGGLFRSPDRGQTWQLVRSLWDRPERQHWMGGGADAPGIHSICVDPRDSRHVILGVSCGGVWSTRDAGETWQCQAEGMRADYMPPERKYDPNVQDPHRVVACPDNPDALWAQHHNGIFRTSDACKSWSAVEPNNVSDFGFAVAVDPHHDDTAFFVPATSDEVRVPAAGNLMVTRTRNGGKTFETLRNGLPREQAYDIVYRHCLDIDASGKRLVFGSTTGGAWITENAGDSWQMLPVRLPPIYCARFAPDRS